MEAAARVAGYKRRSLETVVGTLQGKQKPQMALVLTDTYTDYF